MVVGALIAEAAFYALDPGSAWSGLFHDKLIAELERYGGR